VSTLLLPDSGKVFIDGVEAFKNLSYVREKIGVMLTVEKGFFPKLIGRENLIYYCTGWKENFLKEEQTIF